MPANFSHAVLEQFKSLIEFEFDKKLIKYNNLICTSTPRRIVLFLDGLVDYSDTTNAIELADFVLARTQITCVFGTAVTGDAIYTAEGFLDSVEMSAEMESPVSYSGSITLTGDIVKSTN